MNGSSSLSQGERELILAFAAGIGECDFVFVAHSEVAYAWKIRAGLVEDAVNDLEHADIDTKLRPLLSFVRKLILKPKDIGQEDADAVFSAGWDERALHHAIAIAARAAFMQRLVQGFGFTPFTREVAAKHARKRVEQGYVNLFPVFRTK
jgi:alkylhydroperoxidase family enzyme